MESKNPVFSRTPEFTGRGGYAGFDDRGASRAPSYGQPGATGAATTDAASPQRLEEMYGQPSATPTQTGRMTYDDVIMRTAALFGVLLVTAAYSWFFPSTLLLWVGLGGGLALGLVNAFKREPSAPLILGYGAFQGLFLGTISVSFEVLYPGIVFQAVLATMATFGAMLFLYKSGRIRVTEKFKKIMLVAVAGYAVFSLVNLGIVLFTGDSLRGGVFGLLIGAVGAVLAALMLTLDFDFIDKGVKGGIPAKYAWTAAFGLAVTLIWLYIEFLRIIAILRGGD